MADEPIGPPVEETMELLVEKTRQPPVEETIAPHQEETIKLHHPRRSQWKNVNPASSC